VIIDKRLAAHELKSEDARFDGAWPEPPLMRGRRDFSASAAGQNVIAEEFRFE